MRSRKEWFLVPVGLLAGLLSFEILVSLFFFFPALTKVLPQKLLNSFRTYYSQRVRSIIQFEPDCAEFDPSFSYRLKPGKCVFKNSEFTVDVNINSRGLRDKEEDLFGPEIILLGDSYAMGWGVREQDCFADLLQQKTGLKVLNAGTSSYATEREMLLLGQLDLSRLRLVIVQYNFNDDEENLAYIQNGYILKTMNQQKYEKAVEWLKNETAYYPFKHAHSFASMVLKRLRKREAGKKRAATERAQIYLEVLGKLAPQRARQAQWITVAIGPDAEFSSEVKNLMQEKFFPPFIKRMRVLDLQELSNNPSAWFLLDDHLNAHGHALVAEALQGAVEP